MRQPRQEQYLAGFSYGQVAENVYIRKTNKAHHLIPQIMSIESILGITASVIAIVTAAFQIYKHFQRKSLVDLMNQLVDKKLSTKEHQNILRKINHYLGGNRIRKEYIQGFTLDNRGKEAVFKEICFENNIVPEPSICLKLMNADMKKIREEYFKRENKDSDKATECNGSSDAPKKEEDQTVFMSKLLKERYPDTCARLIQILEKHNVKYAFIEGTRDIWCRDYMPVKTESDQLIQFKYDPSYLKDTPEHIATRSDVDEIHRLNGIKAQKADINLDGGNVLICGGRAIISKKVFTENPGKSEDEIKSELSELLGCEIIIIPIINTDFTGHADGMVRFVNKNTILGNDLATELGYWRKDMLKVLKEYNLTYIDVPFFEDKAHPKHKDSAIGVYVNYLEVNNLIVVPVFEHEKDKEAVEVIKRAFPDRQIETINYSDVALEGGLLNCTTWVV